MKAATVPEENQAFRQGRSLPPEICRAGLAADKAALVRDRPRQFCRESKSGRNARRPAFIRHAPMRTIKGGIDLHATQKGGIASKLATFGRKYGSVRGGNCPACSADDHRGWLRPAGRKAAACRDAASSVPACRDAISFGRMRLETSRKAAGSVLARGDRALQRNGGNRQPGWPKRAARGHRRAPEPAIIQRAGTSASWPVRNSCM